MSNVPVGDVRPSQLLWTYGPGALIDLPNLSVVTMGLNRWDPALCIPIDEARLLQAVRRVLGQQVQRLMMPPVMASEGVDPLSAEARLGVPVRPFPRWLRCVRCGLLAEFDSGLFECKDNPYRPDWTQFIHRNCRGGHSSDAVPARFLLACRNGHLDDFPWHWFVHSGASTCRGTLRFFESGASLQTENLWVKCDSCNDSRSLVHAFGERGAGNLPACRGRHPHLDIYDDDCSEPARAVLLGATNSWFPISIRALAIPLRGNPIAQIVEDGWEYFQDLESLEATENVVRTLQRGNMIAGIGNYGYEEIWQEIQAKREGSSGDDETVSESDMKIPEWQVLTAENPPTEWPHFMSTKVDPPSEYEDYIDSVLLVERLREVNALIGFTRIEAPEEAGEEDERPPMAMLCTGAPDWVPATEVHGEGIFLRFKEEKILNWLEQDLSRERDQNLLAGHTGWRNARRLDPNIGYPGIRYALLHTFSHLLIRELALECGYNAASIRERIYASDDDEPMAGILLYTAAADSDGTLGGLVELGKPENLGRLIKQAMERSQICSSDPLCSEHSPNEDRSLHASACHACSFVAETSCERGNRYLDRALPFPTMLGEDLAFFKKF